jgi:predicted  nucleic acid-binding Zn-ribbon protein
MSVAVSLAAALISGCARPALAPAKTVTFEAPVVEPEQCAVPQTTSLQRYQELSQQFEAEKTRSAALVIELGEQKVARQKAETENEALRSQVESLTAKTAELDALKVKFDDVQKTSFETENSLREAKRQLLEERLAGVKREETIVALKIERAKDARKLPADRTLQAPEPKPAPAAAAEKPVSQSGTTSGGTAIANP